MGSNIIFKCVKDSFNVLKSIIFLLGFLTYPNYTRKRGLMVFNGKNKTKGKELLQIFQCLFRRVKVGFGLTNINFNPIVELN
jgi:hypothetical protein